jgi:hypothetical protein
MKQIDPELVKRAVFVFLHGPTALKEGEWEPILLEILRHVGFKAKSTCHVKNLSFKHGAYCFLVNDQMSFEVQVTSEDDSGKEYVDEHASRWLNELADRVFDNRVDHIKEPERAHGSTMDAYLELVKSNVRIEIGKDPKTLDEFSILSDEAVRVSFRDFFDIMVVELACKIDKSCALEPITLSRYGETFVQADPPGSCGKNLRDEMPLQNGLHEYCGGTISFIRVAIGYTSACCDKCHMRIMLPSAYAVSFKTLRERSGEYYRHHYPNDF